jgi:phage terminase large subunit GpA-like protein
MYLSINTRQLHPTLINILGDTLKSLEPRERLGICEWAERYIKFPETNAKKGYLDLSSMAFLYEILESMADPAIPEVSLMASAQISKTTSGIIDVGYTIENYPAPMIILQPTIDMAEKYSKTKLEPMLRNIPSVSNLLMERRSRDARNTMRYKEFPGGFIIITGANSPVDLAGHSVKMVISEDVDRIPLTAGQEGDPVMLAEERTESFKLYGRKLIRLSTPTIKQTSRIYRLFMQGDQREYYVQCPKCGEYQTLIFDNLKWEKDKDFTGKTIKHYPHKLYYECAFCKEHLSEKDKHYMVSKGHGYWKPARPEIKDHRSYKINRLYSTLSTWTDITKDFIKRHDDPAALRVFWNTTLGEPWELEEALELEIADLMKRCENYLTPENPYMSNNVLSLTSAIDVQQDRLELKIKGWGIKRERWTIDYQQFYGDPNQDDVWDKVIHHLATDWPREDGVTLRPEICLVDSGYNTRRVYEAVAYMNSKLSLKRGVFCIKGKAGNEVDIWPRNFKKVNTTILFVIGTDKSKEDLLASLKTPKNNSDTLPSPGYNHFTSACCTIEYFEQLTAEKRVVKYLPSKGAQYSWIKKKENARNEALDLEVYNIAAENFMYNDYERLAETLAEEARELEARKQDKDFMIANDDGKEEKLESKRKILYPSGQSSNVLYGTGGNFVNSWRK